MSNEIVTREDLHRLVEEHGSISGAARSLGWPRTTFHDRLHAAESTEYTVRNADGTITRQWVKYPVRQPDASEQDRAFEAMVQHVLDRHEPFTPIPAPSPPYDFEDELTLYILADHHLMMLAWKPETGNNYDLKIAETVLKDTMGRLITSTMPTRKAIILNVGDFFHADDNSARTRMHGNQLAVEGRFDKALMLGADMHVWAVQMALQRHEEVELAILPGNHDEYAIKALKLAMRYAFMNEPRVSFPFNPSVFWVCQWGKTMLAAHHGHMVKPVKMPGVMAATWPTIWGDTTHRYAHLGHVHKSMIGGDEADGAIWEVHQTMAARDDWNYSMGFRSGRSMKAITYSKEGGETGRVVQQVRMKR